MAISNPAFRDIIWRNFYIYCITIENRDTRLAHMPRNITSNYHRVISKLLTSKRINLNSVSSIWEGLQNGASSSYFFFFCHTVRGTVYDMWRHCIKKLAYCKFFLKKNKKMLVKPFIKRKSYNIYALQIILLFKQTPSFTYHNRKNVQSPNWDFLQGKQNAFWFAKRVHMNKLHHYDYKNIYRAYWYLYGYRLSPWWSCRLWNAIRL